MAWLCAGMDDQDSLLCLLFGALFVGSMRLEYAGSKTSPGQGWMVQVIYVYASEYCPGGQYSLVNNVQGEHFVAGHYTG